MRYKELRALMMRRFSIPKVRVIERILGQFSLAEKAVFYFLVALFALSGALILWQVNDFYLVEVPTRGGTLTEGVVGNPRFINPVLALSEADKNLSALVYSGLVRLTQAGEIENDLAENISISKDRLTYTITIKSDAQFHDGTTITTDDVVFTISKITDPLIKSPRRGNWDGVTVEKVDDRTVSFALKQAYTPFIYNLTIGILPKHIWKNVSDDEFSFSQFNTLPIGSGPYKVLRVERNSGGIPNFYNLRPFDNGAFIENLSFKFYPSEDALIQAYSNREIDSLSGISPEKILDIKRSNSRIVTSALPRVFAVFFNQSQSKVLLNKEVRQALDLASPKEEIVEKVLDGYGTVISSPLPAGLYSWTSESASAKGFGETKEEKLVKAKEILAKAGWTLNPDTEILEKKSGSGKLELSFSISTGDAPELQSVAEVLAKAWSELGAKVEVLVYETGELNQSVIRPRQFDALLFGEVIGRNADLYPFWHSSQRTDPGLNIALYANSRADRLLEEARRVDNFADVEQRYKEFAIEIEKDVPAVFLYTPSFLYIVPEKVGGIDIESLAVSQDRFLGIRNWYIEKDKVWKIFNN